MSRVLRVVVWSAVGFLLLLFLPILAPVFVLAFTLAFGWIGFLRRVLPELSWNPAAIGMFALCSAVSLAGIQSFGRWLRGDAGWRWKWTLGLDAGLWLHFLTVMGFTGVVHQAGWLVASKDPWFGMRNQVRFSGITAKNDMKSLAKRAALNGKEHQWQCGAMQAAFWAEVTALGTKPPQEKFQALFLPGESNRVVAVIIFPRSRGLQKRAGLALVTPNSARPLSSGLVEPQLLPIGDLPRLLRQYGGITNSPTMLP
jgi:hypothetical protein